jgi:hypothetical protein
MAPMRRVRLGLPGLLSLVTVVVWSSLARAQATSTQPGTQPGAQPGTQPGMQPGTTAPSAARPPAPPAEPAPPPPPAEAPTATPPPGQPPTLAPPPAEPTPASAPPLTLTPELSSTSAPPLELDRRTGQPASERPVPFYKKDWFWGTVGLVVLTATIIVLSTATSDTSPPTTTLGNMHAF